MSRLEISKMLKDIELNAKWLSLVRLNVGTENQASYILSWLTISTRGSQSVSFSSS